jgi:hypothetical protein
MRTPSEVARIYRVRRHTSAQCRVRELLRYLRPSATIRPLPKGNSRHGSCPVLVAHQLSALYVFVVGLVELLVRREAALAAERLSTNPQGRGGLGVEAVHAAVLKFGCLIGVPVGS